MRYTASTVVGAKMWGKVQGEFSFPLNHLKLLPFLNACTAQSPHVLLLPQLCALLMQETHHLDLLGSIWIRLSYLSWVTGASWYNPGSLESKASTRGPPKKKTSQLQVAWKSLTNGNGFTTSLFTMVTLSSHCQPVMRQKFWPLV